MWVLGIEPQSCGKAASSLNLSPALSKVLRARRFKVLVIVCPGEDCLSAWKMAAILLCLHLADGALVFFYYRSTRSFKPEFHHYDFI